MDGQFICALCLDFSSDDPQNDYFTSTECGHIFHILCLKPAYESGHKKCPICRATIVPQNWRKLFGIQPVQKKAKPPRVFNDLRTSSSNSSSDTDYDYRFKVILVGNGHVGKSSLMQRFSDGIYNTSVFATVACDWRSKTIHVGNKKINLSIWDTAGQERHRSLVTNFVRDTHGSLIVYDITDPSSIEDIEMWDKFVTDHGLPDTVKTLVGNKSDLVAERQISKEKGKALARKLGMSFFETSAKDSYNVEAAFRTLCAKILESESLIESIEARKKNPNLQLRETDQVDSTMYTSCVNGLQWLKYGFNGTFNGVKSGWKYVTASSASASSSNRNARTSRN